MYGNELKTARESAGLTPQQLAEITRIHRTVIEQIEREELARLPEPVFVRGYIQQMAKALGIPPDRAKAWIEEYIRQSGELPPHRRDPEFDRESNGPPPGKGMMLGVGIALVILAAVYFLWPDSDRKQKTPVLSSSRTAEEPVPKAAPEENQAASGADDTAMPIAGPSPPAQASDEKAPAVVSPPVEAPPPKEHGTAPAAESARAVAEANSASQPPPAPSSPPPVAADAPPADFDLPPAAIVPPSIPLDGAEESAPPVPEALILTIKAAEEAWLTWQADGEPLQETLLLDGETIKVEARKKIWLKSGNAGGLQMTLNGHKLAPIGSRGKVRTVTYDHATLDRLNETD